MAKVKRGKIKQKAAISKANSSVKQLLIQRRSLLVGSAAVIIVAGLLVLNQGRLKKNSNTSTLPTPINIAKISLPVTAMPSTSYLTPTPTVNKPSLSPTKTMAGKTQPSTSNQPMVKKLPFTAGSSFDYTVNKSDTLYTIGITFCNDKAAWQYLATNNNLYPPYTLHAGDTLRISCQ